MWAQLIYELPRGVRLDEADVGPSGPLAAATGQGRYVLIGFYYSLEAHNTQHHALFYGGYGLYLTMELSSITRGECFKLNLFSDLLTERESRTDEDS